MAEVEEIAHAIAGAGGGALSMIVTYPLVTLSTLAQTGLKRKKKHAGLDEKENEQEPAEEVKKMQSKPKSSEISSLSNIQDFINERGVLGLYKGLESALYGIALTNFIYYYFYEWTSNVFLRSNASHKRRGLSTIQSMLAGAIAGAVTCIGSNPFWVANTRMMTSHQNGPSEKDNSGSAFRTIYSIIRDEGASTLFAGVLPALVLVANPIIQYTIFEQLKNAIVTRKGRKHFTAVDAFFIGALGKLVATCLTYPYITLKARMQSRRKASAFNRDNEKQSSMLTEIRKIITEEGVNGLYAGLTLKLLQSISTAAFLFYFKEELLNGSVKLIELLRMIKRKRTLKQSN